MPDTRRGDWPEKDCSDCGKAEKGLVYIQHWGPLVPPGAVGFFGPACFEARIKENRAGLEPRLLGTKPLSEGHMKFFEWAKFTHASLPVFGTPEFDEKFDHWCQMGMLRDPVG
ncbi:MAG: hypothetical protein V4465_01000 [Patescibacteria group bacterium]